MQITSALSVPGRVQFVSNDVNFPQFCNFQHLSNFTCTSFEQLHHLTGVFVGIAEAFCALSGKGPPPDSSAPGSRALAASSAASLRTARCHPALTGKCPNSSSGWGVSAPPPSDFSCMAMGRAVRGVRDPLPSPTLSPSHRSLGVAGVWSKTEKNRVLSQPVRTRLFLFIFSGFISRLRNDNLEVWEVRPMFPADSSLFSLDSLGSFTAKTALQSARIFRQAAQCVL